MMMIMLMTWCFEFECSLSLTDSSRSNKDTGVESCYHPVQRRKFLPEKLLVAQLVNTSFIPRVPFNLIFSSRTVSFSIKSVKSWKMVQKLIMNTVSTSGKSVNFCWLHGARTPRTVASSARNSSTEQNVFARIPVEPLSVSGLQCAVQCHFSFSCDGWSHLHFYWRSYQLL
jgi:hypothetical protein